MPKLSKEERAELEARLAADDADDDEDDEISVTFPDGHSITGAYRRVKDVAASRGFKLKPDPAPEGEKKDGGTVRKFSGRRVS